MSDFHTYAHAHHTYFQKHSRPMKYKKGQLFVRREEASPWVFFIESGYIKMQFMNESGEGRILGFGIPGMAIAQSGSFYTLPHVELEYEAHTDCVVLRVPKEQFLTDLVEQPKLMNDWHRRIAENHNLLVERTLYIGEKHPKPRIVGWLLGMGKYYSVAQPDGSVLIEMPMTQDIMAGFTHLSRESTNKVVRSLKDKGVIRIQKQYVTIPSVEALRSELYIQL